MTFHPELNFGANVRTLSLLSSSHLGLLRKASQLLDCRGRLSVYKVFLLPISEYAPLACMIAAASHRKHRGRLQRQALGIINNGTLLQRLFLRREFVARCYMY